MLEKEDIPLRKRFNEKRKEKIVLVSASNEYFLCIFFFCFTEPFPHSCIVTLPAAGALWLNKWESESEVLGWWKSESEVQGWWRCALVVILITAAAGAPKKRKFCFEFGCLCSEELQYSLWYNIYCSLTLTNNCSHKRQFFVTSSSWILLTS